jgi:hypothetical protein
MVIVVSEPLANVDVTVTGAEVAEELPPGALALVLALTATSLVVDGNATELDTGVATGSDTDEGGEGADSVLDDAESVLEDADADSDTDGGGEGADSVPVDVDTDSDTDVGGKSAESVLIDVDEITGVAVGLTAVSGAAVVPPSADVVVVTWLSVDVGGGF